MRPPIVDPKVDPIVDQTVDPMLEWVMPEIVSGSA